MTETPKFEGPLRNPIVSEEADIKMDKLLEIMPAKAARRLIPEFAALEKTGELTEKDASVLPVKVTKSKTIGETPPVHVAAELRTPRNFTPINETPEDKVAREQAMRDFPTSAA